MRQGDSVEVIVDRLDESGDGVAPKDGKLILVPGAYPTERVLVRVEHVSKQTKKVRATLLELQTPHPARRASPCGRSALAEGECGGCPLIALDAEAQGSARRRMLAIEHGLEVDRLVGIAGAELGYRWSSKRVAFGRPGELHLGSWARGSHRPVRMDGCPIEHPKIAEAIERLEEAAAIEGVVPYDERTRRGDLRYAWFKTDGERVLITLITGEESSRAAELLPPRLEGYGVSHSVQSAQGNAVRGAEPRRLAGIGELDLELAGVALPMGALGFLQPNPPVAELAYRDLVGDPEGEPLAGSWALDLYAGAGITTSLLRRAFDRVSPCEAYPESAERLGVRPERVEAFLERLLGERVEGQTPPELVVANPPRGGMGATVCAALCELRPRRLTIMSCSARALRRDLDRLTGAGGPYDLVAVRAYDTLPQTAHVELLAWLEVRR